MSILGTERAIRADVLTGSVRLQRIGFKTEFVAHGTGSRDGHGGGDTVRSKEISDCMVDGIRQQRSVNGEEHALSRPCREGREPCGGAGCRNAEHLIMVTPASGNTDNLRKTYAEAGMLNQMTGGDNANVILTVHCCSPWKHAPSGFSVRLPSAGW